jgi:hypothetical protein
VQAAVDDEDLDGLAGGDSKADVDILDRLA